jgi:hypothetical protein
MDQVHEFVDRAGVAGPRFHHGLHSGRRSGLRATAACREGGDEKVAMRRTGDEALATSSHGAGTIEEGRRGGEGVTCSIRVRVPFYRVGREAGAARNGGRWQ